MNVVQDNKPSSETKKKNQELLTKEEIPDTPFTIIGVTDKRIYFGAMGEYRITEEYEDKEELKKELLKIGWSRIVQITGILIEKLK